MTTPDPCDARLALGASGLLADFNLAGVLDGADVHVARRLVRFAAETDETVALAAALAVRAPRLGHVHVDLATARAAVTVDVEDPADLDALAWPETAAWVAAVAASPLVATDDGGPPRPLRLAGTRLALERHWRDEHRTARDLRALAVPVAGVDLTLLRAGLCRLFAGDEPGSRQRVAAAAAVLSRLAVVAGGPGTGKTTTVARIAALLAEQAAGAGAPAPLIALAAPTGKAAARLEEAVREQAADLDTDEAVRAHLGGLGATTLHRLLGWRPGGRGDFRHHRRNRLPHDVVVVDETSMVSLGLMARLVEAVRPGARLVLVGDPGQLASVEAGAVLGDVVGPAAAGLRMGAAARARLGEATGVAVAASDPPAGVAIGDGIVVLDRVHRFGRGIAAVADAIGSGDADAAVMALRDHPQEVTWLDADAADPASEPGLAVVRDALTAAAGEVTGAAEAGDALAAVRALGAFRLLCAHRHGPYGVSTWTGHAERWLRVRRSPTGGVVPWYPGRPLLVTENDHGLRLFNGDSGVVVAGPDDRMTAAFERGDGILRVVPGRLSAVETVYAMTVHKAQGSQFGTAALLLPEPGSRLLTRELLYTAVTRAREHLVVVGTEAAVRAAVARPVARASGLRSLLWERGDRGTPAGPRRVGVLPPPRWASAEPTDDGGET